MKLTEGELNNLRYTRNLVAFIECLEKSVCNAIDGTATALPTAQKVSIKLIKNQVYIIKKLCSLNIFWLY